MKRLSVFLLLACALVGVCSGQRAGPFTMSSGASPCAIIQLQANTNSTVAITVNGTFSMTLQPEVIVAGQTAANVQVTPSTSTTAQSTITAAGVYYAAVGPVDTFQVCVTSYVSGTATIYLNAGSGVNASLFGGGGAGGSVTSVGLAGTANQITVTGASPITSSGSWTLSFPTSIVLNSATGGSEGAGTLNVSGGYYVNGTLIPAGTVTSVTFTGDGVIDSSTPSSAVTASGTIAATVNSVATNKWIGNNTGSTAALAASSIGTSDTTPNFYAADTGAVNAAVVTLSPAMLAYTTGVFACFKPTANSTNTTPTVNFNGLGATTIVRLAGGALAAGDLNTHEPACVVYDGTDFDLLNPANSTGSGTYVLNTSPTFKTSTILGEGSFGDNQTNLPTGCATSFGTTTVNTGSATTTTAVACLPANSVIDAVVYRITTTITTAASFTVGQSGSTSQFCSTQSTLTSGTTGICVPSAYAAQASAADVVVTFNTTPGAGALRLIVYSHTWTAPTS